MSIGVELTTGVGTDGRQQAAATAMTTTLQGQLREGGWVGEEERLSQTSTICRLWGASTFTDSWFEYKTPLYFKSTATTRGVEDVRMCCHLFVRFVLRDLTKGLAVFFTF